jgi:hypothetical protein
VLIVIGAAFVLSGHAPSVAVAPASRLVAGDFQTNRRVITEAELRRFVGLDVQNVFNVLSGPDILNPDGPTVVFASGADFYQDALANVGAPFTGTFGWRNAMGEGKTIYLGVRRNIVTEVLVR